MLWAQWILLVSMALWNLVYVNALAEKVKEHERLSYGSISPEIGMGVVLLVLAMLAGAFDKIVGWPS